MNKITEICIYLTNSPIIHLIKSARFVTKLNNKTSCYLELTNYKQAIQLLIDSPYFINADLGYLHYLELNGKALDFRSKTQGINKLGNKSLQININPQTGQARADLDFYNPVENLESFIKHLGEVVNLY